MERKINLNKVVYMCAKCGTPQLLVRNGEPRTRCVCQKCGKMRDFILADKRFTTQ